MKKPKKMSTDNDKIIEVNVRHLARELQNTISRTDIHKHDLQQAFDTVGELLNIRNKGILLKRFADVEIEPVKSTYQQYHYARLLHCFIGLFSVEWIKSLPTNSRECCSLEDLIIHGIPKETFYALSKSISEFSPGYKLNKCVSLLEKFLQQDKLSDVIYSHCHGNQISKAGAVSQPRVDQYQVQQWDQLNTYIVTLPERVTNKLQRQTGELFYPDSYIPLLCRAVLKSADNTHSRCQKELFYPDSYIPLVCRAVLKSADNVHRSVKKNEPCSLELLSHLLGKLCLSGHGDRVWGSLLPDLKSRIDSDPLWCRMCERLVCAVPDKYMESLVIPLVQNITWYGYMCKFLGHSVLENQKVKFLLTNKLLLLRHFKQHRILQNILGYLSESVTLKPLFLKTMVKLLEVWGDKSALKHTSYEQHLYITKAVLVATGFISEKDAKQIEGALIKLLMTGVGVHLDSSLPAVRRQGMIVAEALTHKVHIQADQKLTFQYDNDEETRELKSLLVPPENPGLEDIQTKLENTQLPNDEVKSEVDDDMNAETNMEQEELDSDDDLEPYDLSNDKKLEKEKPPVYIRDCMEGLITSNENPDRFECCLEVTEKLIKQHPTAAKEVAVELTKVLLHLQDNFSLASFVLLRHGAMLALLVLAPEKVADYLTTQFFERNYNIRQRLDILEVLCSAAKELSDPGADKTPSSSSGVLISEEKSTEKLTETEHWKDVVQRRIDSKTRRFASGRITESKAVSNKFAPVAGFFFFPLLARFDSKENTLDMLGEDHIVLGRLCYSLGVLMYQAQHAPVCRNMGKALLEFIWVLRYHPQPAIRQSLLFSTCMVLLALPPHILLEDLQSQCIETKIWLQDVAGSDSDRECQKMAVQALVVMENIVKQQFSSEVK